MKKLILAAASLLVMIVAGISFLALKYGEDDWDDLGI